MFLYHLQRTDVVEHRDEMRALVVAADSEESAREHAALAACDEGEELWLGPFVDCHEIGLAFVGDAGVICADVLVGG